MENNDYIQRFCEAAPSENLCYIYYIIYILLLFNILI